MAQFVGDAPEPEQEINLRLVHKETIVVSRYVLVNDQDEMIVVNTDESGEVYEVEFSARAHFNQESIREALTEIAGSKETFLKNIAAKLKDAARRLQEQIDQ
jgi:hypothetical protein